MVRFGKNGGDAATIAILLEQLLEDKKNCILWLSWLARWFIASTDKSYNGIPGTIKANTLSFEYSNIEFRENDEDNKNEISCVIMEPITVPEPKCFTKICRNNLCS